MYKLSLLLLTFTMTLTSIGQTSKENDFAKKVLEAFKSKDYKTYKNILTTRKDLEELFADIQQHDGVQRQQEWKQSLKKFDEQADSTYQAEFKRILEKGEKLGIDWTQVQFTNFVFRADKAVNSSKTSLTGHINFVCKGSTYILFGVEAMELSNGYKLNMLRTVQKGGLSEYVDPDLMDDDDI
jgi:hypothetical protein